MNVFPILIIQKKKSNAAEKPLLKKIKELAGRLDVLQARIFEDPWIRSILNVDNLRIDVSFHKAVQHSKQEMPFWAALAFLVSFLVEKLVESLQKLRTDFRLQ